MILHIYCIIVTCSHGEKSVICQHNDLFMRLWSAFGVAMELSSVQYALNIGLICFRATRREKIGFIRFARLFYPFRIFRKKVSYISYKFPFGFIRILWHWVLK